MEAQSEDAFLKGFDQGDIEFPWSAGEVWFLTSGYGHSFHQGQSYFMLNFAKSSEQETFNQPVLAMTNGIVREVNLGCQQGSALGCNGGLGNNVVIQVSPTMYIEYHHLSLTPVFVGQKIVRGSEIGRTGTSGFTNSFSDIQVALYERPGGFKNFQTQPFPPIRGLNLNLNESPVLDSSVNRTFHAHLSSNTVGNYDNDGDGISNLYDNCPDTFNPDQEDSDGILGGPGLACDLDRDAREDYISDNCSPPKGWDGTGVEFFFNPDQMDINGNGIGDTCDFVDCVYPAPGLSEITRQYLCSLDYDNDGVINISDNCVFIFNSDQKDSNGNGVGDVCDMEMRVDRSLYNPKSGYYRNMGYDIPIGTIGDPVNSSTGNFFRTEVDIELPGPGKGVLEEIEPELKIPIVGLKFERTYNQQDQRDSIFGPGWSSDLLTYVDFYQTPSENNPQEI